MPTYRAKVAAAGALALAVLAGLPALGQDKPESILPPGFGEPSPTPVPSRSPRAGTGTGTGAPSTSPLPPPVGAPPTDTGSPRAVRPSSTPPPVPTTPSAPEVTGAARFQIPEALKRSTATVGIEPVGGAAFGAGAYGQANGRYIEALMRRVRAPIASRWMHIVLRRLLAAPTETPSGIDGADFAAERAWLLIRMGEPTVARAVVQAVDPDDYTPKLYQVAMQAALATGDPGALCGLVDQALPRSDERGWRLIQAICRTLEGYPAQATPLLAAARRARVAQGVDFLLAQKLVGAGGKGRQAVTIEWNDVDRLTIWRYGLATASGETIPAELFRTTGPQVRYWRALAPQSTPVTRAPLAEAAGAQGVLSNAALVDLYSAIDAGDDQGNVPGATARGLNTAYTAANRDARLAAMRQLWGAVDAGGGRYGRLVLTARAATLLRPAAGVEGVDDLVASMLTSGYDRPATRWAPYLTRGGLGWAVLAVGRPDGGAALRENDVDAFRAGGAGGDRTRAAMFFAALAGLGRLDQSDLERGARDYGVAIGATDSWTRAIDRAAGEGRVGEVVLLAALGMGTPGWRGVPPEVVFRGIAALRAVGLEPEARMLAAEAITRR